MIAGTGAHSAAGSSAVSVETVRTKRLDRERLKVGTFVMLAPASVLLLLLFAVPVVYSFYLGFTNLTLIGPHSVAWSFTGGANVSRLINDPTFIQSLLLTALFVFGSVAGVVLIGLALAFLLQSAGRLLTGVVGGSVMVAWMMPAVPAGLAWYASTTAGGTFATLLGLNHADLLNSQPLLIVTLANVWSTTGFAMLVLAAALRNIPLDVLEAAEVEGASSWQRFWRITLPLLKPTVVTTAMLVFLLSLANFGLIYIMTQGGPGTATSILPIYSYQQAFQFFNLGYGALIGDVLVLVTIIVGLVYVRAFISNK